MQVNNEALVQSLKSMAKSKRTKRLTNFLLSVGCITFLRVVEGVGGSSVTLAYGSDNPEECKRP